MKNTINWLSILFFIFFLGINIYIISGLFINFPISDDFGAIVNYQIDFLNTNGFLAYFKLFFSQNNDFKLVILKLIVSLDYFIFGKINFKHFKYFGFLSYLITLIYFFKQGKFKLKEFYFFLPVPLILVSFAYAEINTLAMESISHFIVIISTTACFYYLYNSKYFFITILLLFISVFSNGNGLLVIPIGALGLFIKKRYKDLAIWLVFSTAFLCLFFFNYQKGNDSLSMLNVNNFFRTFAAYIGGLGGYESLNLNKTLGYFAIISALYLLFYKNIFKDFPAKTSLILFFLGTYFLISLKRIITNDDQIFRGAYIINSVCVFTVLYILLFNLVIEKLPKYRIVVFMLVLGFCSFYQFRNYTRWYSVFNAHKVTFKKDIYNMLSNNSALFLTEKSTNNIPLVNISSLEKLIKTKGFNPNAASDLFLVKKVSKPDLINKPTDKIKVEINSINGTNTSQNPYISIKAKVLNFVKGPKDKLYLEISQKSGSSYYEIPVENDIFYFAKNSKGRITYVDFIIPKTEIKGQDFYIKIINSDQDLNEKSLGPFVLNTDVSGNIFPEISNLPPGVSKKQLSLKLENFEGFVGELNHEMTIKIDSVITKNKYYFGFSEVENKLNFKIPAVITNDNYLTLSIDRKKILSFIKVSNMLCNISIITEDPSGNFSMQELGYSYNFY